MYVILGAAVLSGILAVFLAVKVVFSGVKASDVDEFGEEVQLFANAIPAATTRPRKNRRLGDRDDFISGVLADLPEGFHILSGLRLTLPRSKSIRGTVISTDDIDYLIIGPRRLFVLSRFGNDGKILKSKISLVSEYLRQILSKEFKVVGWSINENESEVRGNNTIRLSDLKNEIIRLERYSQGKNNFPAGDFSHEILAVFKLSRWEKGVTNDVNEDRVALA